MTRDEVAADYLASIAIVRRRSPAELLAGRDEILISVDSRSGDVSRFKVPVTPELIAEAERLVRSRRFGV